MKPMNYDVYYSTYDRTIHMMQLHFTTLLVSVSISVSISISVRGNTLPFNSHDYQVVSRQVDEGPHEGQHCPDPTVDLCTQTGGIRKIGGSVEKLREE